MEQSRRGFLGFLLGGSAGVVAGVLPAGATPQSVAATTPAVAPPPAPVVVPDATPLGPTEKIHAALRERFGDDIYSSWFHTLKFESYERRTVTVSLPVKFLRTWVQSHYRDELLHACRVEFWGARRVRIILRQPGSVLPTKHRCVTT
jgi:chromosomal replication initiator protein